MPRLDPTAPGALGPLATGLGLRCTLAEGGESCCLVTVGEEHQNPQQVAHGAVLYALADTGMGAALYTLLDPGELCATIDVHIAYYTAIRTGQLRCTTRVMHRGRTTAGLMSEIHQGDTLVACAMGSFAIFIPSGRA